MVSKIIIDSIVKNAKLENKDLLINIMIEQFNQHNYNEDKVNRCLEILSGGRQVLISKEDISIDYVEKHIADFVYNGDKYLYKNVKVTNIDNIECNITISFDKIEKTNKDRDDIKYISDYAVISWFNIPAIILK